MGTLYRGPHFVLQLFQASGYVRLVRTSEPFASVAKAIEGLRDCHKSLEGLRLSELGILLDWRAGPMSTDAKLHQSVVTHTDAFASEFRRKAVLVSTPVGGMQIQRVSRVHSDAPPTLFNDEQEAIAYVTDAPSARPSVEG